MGQNLPVKEEDHNPCHSNRNRNHQKCRNAVERITCYALLYFVQQGGCLHAVSCQSSNHKYRKQDDRPAQITEKAGNADLPGMLSTESPLIRHLAEAQSQDQPIDQIVGWNQDQPQPRRTENQNPYGQKNVV